MPFIPAAMLALAWIANQANSLDADSSLGEIIRTSSSRSIDIEDKIAAIDRIYETELVRQLNDADKLSDQSLHSAYQAMRLAFFYSRLSEQSHASIIILNLHYLYNLLVKRGIATADETKQMYESLITSRQFTEAEFLKESSNESSLPAIPSIQISNQFDKYHPAMYSLDTSKTGLVLHNATLRKKGPQIIIVAECHFARDAASAIANDPVLNQGFIEGNAIWIEGDQADFSTREIYRWNVMFPNHPLSIAYSNPMWTNIKFTASPAFFFFKDGQLISKQEGWSSKTSPKLLIKSLASIGVN